MTLLKKSLLSIAAYVLFIFVLPGIVFLIGSLFSSYSFSEVANDETVSNIVSILGYVLLFISLCYLNIDYIKQDYSDFKEKFSGFGATVLYILKILGVFVLYFIVVSVLLNTLIVKFITSSTAENQTAVGEALNSPLGILVFFIAVFIGPIVEELIFRKAIFNIIENKWVALLVGSSLFGLVHVIGDWTHFFSYFSAGLAYSFIYIKSDKNLFWPLSIHIINNALGALILVLA